MAETTDRAADWHLPAQPPGREGGALGGRSDYDTDIVEWSEQQAALLRRVAAGERVNDLDWPNIIEEIESVGNEQVRSVESLLFQALVHDLKAEAWPDSPHVPHWLAEARGFRAQASLRFAPSMRQRIDVLRLYAKAIRVLPETVDGAVPRPVADRCPVTLDELLDEI
jgi:hypothetical protein